MVRVRLEHLPPSGIIGTRKFEHKEYSKVHEIKSLKLCRNFVVQ